MPTASSPSRALAGHGGSFWSSPAVVGQNGPCREESRLPSVSPSMGLPVLALVFLSLVCCLLL